MKKLSLIILAVLSISLTTGCSKLENTFQKWQQGAVGGYYKVEFWSGGKMVRQWKVEGFVSAEDSTDGYYWDIDGKTVQVSGDVVILQIDKDEYEKLDI